MRHLYRILPALLILALVASQGLAQSMPTLGGCPGIDRVERCLDPSLPTTADKKTGQGGKTCLDALLAGGDRLGVAGRSGTFATDPDTPPERGRPASPWKPPRALS